MIRESRKRLRNAVKEAFEALESIVEDNLPEHQYVGCSSGEQTNTELRYRRTYESSTGLEASVTYTANTGLKNN